MNFSVNLIPNLLNSFSDKIREHAICHHMAAKEVGLRLYKNKTILWVSIVIEVPESKTHMIGGVMKAITATIEHLANEIAAKTGEMPKVQYSRGVGESPAGICFIPVPDHTRFLQGAYEVADGVTTYKPAFSVGGLHIGLIKSGQKHLVNMIINRRSVNMDIPDLEILLSLLAGEQRSKFHKDLVAAIKFADK